MNSPFPLNPNQPKAFLSTIHAETFDLENKKFGI